MQTDVLVIGAGGAGLLAARAAAMEGASVLVACKGIPGRGSATFVAGGIAASGPSPDSVEQHYADTMEAGMGLNDPPLVRLMVEGVNPGLEELERQGARFDRDERGEWARRPRAGHRFPRHCVARGDGAGQETVQTAQRSLEKAGVGVRGDLFVSRLARIDGEVVGAVGMDLRSGELVSLSARAVVLSAGGFGRLYPMSSLPAGATGDGYALAGRAGAELRDMEMVIFHPGGFYAPGMLRGLSCSEPSQFAAQGARIVNGLGEEFLGRYDQRGEFATRDALVRAEYAEIAAGRGSPNGGVYLDLSGMPREARVALPRASRRMYGQCRVAGLEIATRDDRIEIGPSVCYTCGGVLVDQDGKTGVPGLFTCGEVAGGAQGASRLAGNSMAELLSLAPRVGRAAARHARGVRALPSLSLARAEEQERIHTLLRPSSTRSTEVERELQQTMWRSAGVIREEAGLLEGAGRLRELREVRYWAGVPAPAGPYNPGLLHALEISNLIDVGEMVVASALHRRESRGAHFREDFPERDDRSWKTSVLCRREGEQLRTWTRLRSG